MWYVFAREVPLEGAAVPVVVPCASIGRSVGLRGGLCVCVSLCAGTWSFGWICLFGGFGRWPAPLSFPPLTGPWLMPRLGGPLLGGPLHGAVLRGPLPLVAALRGTLFVGFFALLGALRARLAAAVLVGLRAAAFGRLGCVDAGS
jgi:hypothetical protein